MNEKENAFKSLISTSITEFIGYIFNFLILYILILNYPLKEFVYYPFASVFLIFFLIFANFGLGTTIIRYLSALKEDGLEKIKKIFTEGFRLIFLFTLTTSLIFFFMADLFEQIYNMPNLALMLKFTSLYLFFSNLINYIQCAFRGLLNFKIYSSSSITLNSLRLFIVSLNLIYKKPIFMVIALFSVIALIQFIIIIIFIQVKHNFFINIFNFDRELSKDLLKFSIFVFFLILFQFLIINFNQFILAYYVNSNELAYYFITLMFMLVLSMPIIILSKIIPPYVSNYMHKKGKGKMYVDTIYNSIYKYGLLIMIPIIIYFFCFSELLVVLLFNNTYYPVSDYLRIYIFYLIIELIDLTGNPFLLASNEPKTVFKIKAITALFTLILSMLLIPYYYVYGAIISIIIPHSICVIYTSYLVKKKNRIKFGPKVISSIIKYIISSIISFLFISLIILIFNIKLNLINFLIIISGIYVGIFFAFIIIFQAISIEEIKKFIKFLKFQL